MRALAVTIAALALSACATASNKSPVMVRDPGRYEDVNGLKMYYEVHGPHEDVPLVLLHGGGSTIQVTFGKILPFLAQHRRIIAVEEQGHGRTSQRPGPVTFEQSADDVAALLKKIGVAKADVFGFSNGGEVGMQMAIRHPAAVRKLIFASSFTKKSGAPPQLWKFIKAANFENMPQPLKDEFLKVNPDPKALREMHDKDAARMKNFKDFPDKDVASIRAPTLIMFGDRDIVTFEHANYLRRLIKDARILVLPGGHGDYMGELVFAPKETRGPELTAGLVLEWLKE